MHNDDTKWLWIGVIYNLFIDAAFMKNYMFPKILVKTKIFLKMFAKPHVSNEKRKEHVPFSVKENMFPIIFIKYHISV